MSQAEIQKKEKVHPGVTTATFRRAISVAVILAVVASLLSPPVPAYAISTHTWTTEADFEAGVLNQVDTSSNPGAVLLATHIDTGTGASVPW